MRCFGLLTALIVFLIGGVAQACNTPNPNLLAPPFVDGCDLPAAALNNLMHVVSNPAQITPITTDGSVSSATNSSNTLANTVYNQAVFSGAANIFTSNDAFRGAQLATASSTVNTITGVAGYTLNNTVPIGQKSQTISLFGVGVCAVNSSNCWGLDTILSDNPTLANTGVTAGTGKFLFNELDLNLTSPNTQGANLQVGGTALPTNVTMNVNAIGVNKLWGAGGQGTGTALYSNGFVTADACCSSGLTIGAQALSGASVNSQPVTFNYRAGNNTVQNITLTGSPSGGGTAGTLVIGGSGSADNVSLAVGSVFLPSSSNVSFNNNVALSSDGTSTINLGTASTPWTALGLGNASTTVSILGSTVGIGSSGAAVNVGNTGASTLGLGSATSTVNLNGSVIAANLPTQAHAGSNACLGYNASTHAIYISSTITTC